jgi:hypothetical protein
MRFRIFTHAWIVTRVLASNYSMDVGAPLFFIKTRQDHILERKDLSLPLEPLFESAIIKI